MEENSSAPNLSNDEVIDLFVDGIIEEKGIDAPTDEIKKQVHDEVKNRLLTEIDRSLVAELPDEKLTELYDKAEDNGGTIDPKLVAQAIEEAGLDTVEITGITMQRFRNMYLGRPIDADDDNQPSTKEAGA